ncbi:MAG: quinone oxidoreductase [Chromatiales bacterium]|jgi:NADPH2:quinone reductase|nr:MAG: quinone oxidoreductase [Chromatiales bacterium]
MNTTRTQAIRVHGFGGPEVLHWESVELPAPTTGEVTIRQTAVGLNFIDTYHRSGLYPLELPTGIGVEAAGMVEALGPGVAGIAVGDWVAYTGLPPGAYAQRRNWPVDRLVKLPKGITDDVAASLMLKGLTAWYLLRRSYRVEPGDTVLLYAAAGGTGTLLSQWAKALGARVIGVVSTAAKAELARAYGCAETVLADDSNFVKKVRDLSDGGVSVVYDSIGRDTFIRSLDCLRKHGTMVTFGNASGPVEPFSPMELVKRGSLHLTRPSVFDFIATRADLEAGTGELFSLIARGAVRTVIGQRFPLGDAARAHRELESRKTTGATILDP